MDRIKIRVKDEDPIKGFIFCLAVFVFIFWLSDLLADFSAKSLILFLIIYVPLIICAIADANTPTFVTADSEKLTYKHGWKIKKFPLSQIKKLTCEPYEVRTRYGSYYRIRLLIFTDEDCEFEINDAVDSEKLIIEKLNGSQNDIPLIRLYDFLKEKTRL